MKNTTFNLLVEKSTHIPFSSRWRTMSGDYNNAVIGNYAYNLEPGDIASSVDTNGRQFVIIGTNGTGNIILYEQYVNAKEERVIVSNETIEFAALVETITGYSITEILDDIKVLAICETISRGLTNTRTDWADRARALDPWSVV